MKVLILEDVDSKYEDVKKQIESCLSTPLEIARASNLNDAEDAVCDEYWDLVVVDLSMDINGNGSIQGAGHASLGGLDVLERMSLLKLNLPVLVVTGFDSFQDTDRFDNAIMNLSDINGLAKNWLGSCYIGCVRYGVDNWSRQLAKLIQKWNKK